MNIEVAEFRQAGGRALPRGYARSYSPATHVLQADVAQLVEQLICNQQVTGSSPIVSSRRNRGRTAVHRETRRAHRGRRIEIGRWGPSEAGPLKQNNVTASGPFDSRGPSLRRWRRQGGGGRHAFFRSIVVRNGEVPKRSNGADCKSAGLAFGGSNPPLSTTVAGYGGRRMTRRQCARSERYGDDGIWMATTVEEGFTGGNSSVG